MTHGSFHLLVSTVAECNSKGRAATQTRGRAF